MTKLVLLPGLDGTGLLFKPFIDNAPKNLNIKVVTYPNDERLSYCELVDLVLLQLPNEDFVIIAESFSGYIAYMIGLKKPKHLKSIIFVATFLYNPRPLLLGVAKVLPMSLLLKVSIPNFIIKKFLLGDSASVEAINLFKQAIITVDSKVMAHRLKLISKLKTPTQKSSIKATYLQASNDKLVGKNSVELFKKLFSNLTTHKVIGSHFLMQANPKKCASIIIE